MKSAHALAVLTLWMNLVAILIFVASRSQHARGRGLIHKQAARSK